MKFYTRSILFCAAIFGACFWSSSAPATLYIYEPFGPVSPNIGYNPGDNLEGQINKQPGTTAGVILSGAGTPWRPAYGAGTPPTIKIDSTSGSLSDPANILRTSTGNELQLLNGGGNGANRLGLNNTTTVTSGTIYYSFLMRVDSLAGSNNTSGDYFLSLNNTANANTTANPSNVPGQMRGRIDPNDNTKFSLGMFTQRTPTQADPAWVDGLTVGQTLFVVGAFNVGASPNNSTRFWINPAADSFEAVSAPTPTAEDTTGGSNGGTIGSILLHHRSPSMNLTLDELRVANTWAEVTPTHSLYWDLNGATAGAGSATPSGTWNGSSTNWSTDSSGSVATQAWTPGVKARFSAGSDATGTYTVSVDGTQSTTGLTFEEGTVTLGTSTGGKVSLIGAGTINVNSGQTATLDLEVTGSVGLTKASAGTLVLSSDANTYTGATTVSSGTLQVGNGGTSGAIPIGSAIVTNGTLALNHSDNLTQGTDFNGAAITGTGGLTQMGAGTLTLNTAHTFSGTTRATAGTLLLTHSLALQNSILELVTANAGSVVIHNSLNAVTIGALSGTTSPSGMVLNNGNPLALSVGNNTASYSGALSGDGSLTKIGSGAQTLLGTNTYTGGTTINAGVLQFGQTVAMPTTGGVTVNSGGTMGVNAGGASEWTDSIVTTDPASIASVIVGTGGQGVTNQVTWMPGSTFAIDTTNAPGAPTAPDLTYNGVIGGFRTSGGGTTNNVGFMKRGTGTLRLNGDHTFSGPLSTAASGGTLVLNGTALNAGTSQAIPTVSVGSNSNLQLGASDRLPSGSLITTQSQGRFQLMGFHQTVRSLSGTNGFVEVGTGRLDIVDQAGDDYTYGNGTSTATIVTSDSVFNPNQGTVYKSGAGMLTLKTPSTNFNGTFIMENGTLRLSHAQVFGTSSNTGRLVVKGGQLARNDTPTSNYTYGVFAVDLHVFRYDLSDDAARTSQFASTTVTTLKENEVEINITNTGVQTGTSGRFNFPGVIRNHNPIEPGEDLNAIRGIRKTGNGVLALIGDSTHPNTYLGPTTIEDGVVLTSFISTIGDYSQTTIAPINLKGGILATADRRVDPTTSVSYPIKNPINVEGNGTIAFFGSGSQTAGVLMELDNSIVGTSGTLTIANLNVHTSASSTFQPRFTGSGFNFARPIIISGAVTVGTGVKTSELQGGNTSGPQTFSGPISGGGSFRRLNAGGTTVLSGNNTYSGGTTVEAGTLTASGSSATFGSGNVTVTGGILSILSGVTNAIANAATLSIATSGMVDLGGGINESLAFLKLDGFQQANGTYGSTASSATFQNDTYFSGTGILTVAGLLGDFNSDGKVDAGDYVTWRKNQNTNNALANDNGLGTPVGTAHYDLWRANFGNPPGAGSGGGLNGSGAVPEPTSLMLLICAAGAALVTCGRRKR